MIPPLRHHTLLLSALWLLGAFPLSANDWPSWRGPDGTGTSPARHLPEDLGDKKNIAWTAPLPGPGAGTPAIVGERLFLPAVDGDEVVALCLDTRTGRERWRARLGNNQTFPRGGNAAQPSPVADAKHVYFLTGTGALAAFTHDGKAVWSVDATSTLGKFQQLFGYGASPLLRDGKLIVTNLIRVERGPSMVAAFAVADGRVIWKKERPTKAKKESAAVYASPVAFDYLDRPAAIVAGGDCITLHDLESGTELARVSYVKSEKERKPNWRLVSSPVASGPHFNVCGPRGSSVKSYLVKNKELELRDNLTGSNAADVCTPALSGDRLFVLNGRNRRLSCYEPTALTPFWTTELPLSSPIRASPVVADGKVYCISTDGVLTIFQDTVERPTLPINGKNSGHYVRSFKLDLHDVLASPAIAGDAIYLRGGDRLVKLARP